MKIDLLTRAQVVALIKQEVRSQLAAHLTARAIEASKSEPIQGFQKLEDDQTVRMLKPSSRVANTLENAGIHTIGELCSKTPGEMLKYRNFGKACLNEIETRLMLHGRALR